MLVAVTVLPGASTIANDSFERALSEFDAWCAELLSPMQTGAEAPRQHSLAAHDDVSNPDERWSAIDAFRAAHGEFADNVRRYEPMIVIAGLYDPNGSVHTEPGEFRLLAGDMEALVPVPVSMDTFLLFGAHGGARDYDFSDDTQGASDDTLYKFGLRLGAGHFFHDDFVLQGYWQPSVYSDLQGSFGMDDVRLEYGVVLAAYRVREDFFLKAGLAFTDALDTGVIPLGGFSWVISEDWRLDVLPPRSIELSVQPFEPLHLLLGTDLYANEYHIRDPSSLGGKSHFVHVQDIRAYLGVILRAGKTSLLARLGIAYAGRYDWNGGRGPNYRGDREPSLFAQIGIGWSF